MDTITIDQRQASMYGFIEPQTIQILRNIVEQMQTYLQT